MNDMPTIRGSHGSSDFHDSSLVAFHYLPIDETVVAVLSTPNRFDEQELWQINLSGVLAVEFETLGSGEPPVAKTPPEIYDVYDESSGHVVQRWVRRLEQLGVSDPNVHVIVFASSFIRGWGINSELEGIRVVCRKFEISRASREYQGHKFARPRIESRD